MTYMFKLARRLAEGRVAVLLGCLLAAGCTEDDPAPLSPNSETTTSSSAEEDPRSRTRVALRITPDSITLAAGETVEFSASAVYRDGTSGTVAVTWSAAGGTIDTNGLFTASDTAGTFYVIARDSVLADTITATIGASAAAIKPSMNTAALTGVCSGSYQRLVQVSTASQLASALANAQPGDKILLADGTYARSSQWNITRSGTASDPIRVCGSRRAVLTGSSPSTWAPLALSGARYWIFSGFTITNTKIGINTAQASDNVFDSLAIYNIGQEAIHLRTHSKRNAVQRNQIYNTGRATPAYGDGVYIGTAPNQWGTYTGGQPDRSDSNRVIDNVFGPGVAAENVDIKSGTTGGIVSGNAFSGVGYVSGSASAPPVWVSVKGNNYSITNNSGYDSALDGFEVKVLGEAPGWGNHNVFASNTANVLASGYGFRIGSGTSGNVVHCSNTVTNASAGFANVQCQSGSTPEPAPEPEPEPEPEPAVASVAVSPSTSTLVVGETVQLKATAKDGAGSVISGTATWASSNSSVASVSSSGFVKGLAEGTAKITATISGVTGSATITVNAPVAPPPTTAACSGTYTRLVAVSTASQLASALANARAGDKIVLADGTYRKDSQWNMTADGTASNPIRVCGSRRAVIDGGGVNNWRPLALSGANYWIFSGFTITNTKIGINAEGSNHNVFDSLAIYNVGQEAIHLRKHSSRNVIQRNYIYSTGRSAAAYGEAVYIGTAPNQWGTYTGGQPDRSDYNQILNNVFGGGITAENIDVKSGTTGGVIRGNALNGSGHVSGYSSAPPVWVSVKGSGYSIVGNRGSDSDLDGFEVKVLGEAPGWGNNNVFSSNTANVLASGYGFRIGSGTSGNVIRCDNVVTNAGSGVSNVRCQ
jgi:uncharacterized protein YjdB